MGLGGDPLQTDIDSICNLEALFLGTIRQKVKEIYIINI